MAQEDQGKFAAESAPKAVNKAAGTYDWRSTLDDRYIAFLKRRKRWKDAGRNVDAHQIASLALQLAALDVNKRSIFNYLEDAFDLLAVTDLFLVSKALVAEASPPDRATDDKTYAFDEILENPSLTWKTERGLFKAIERGFGRDGLKAIKARKAISHTELAELLADLRKRNQERTRPARQKAK